MPNPTCSLPDCDKPLKRAGYCYGHYMKNWRYGTPTPDHRPTWVDLRGQRFGTLIVMQRQGAKWRCLCDCGRERLTPAGDLNRSGDGSSCGDRATHWRTDDAGYGAAHERCRSDYGPILSRRCIECGEQARHWSYNHDDPDERLAYGLSAKPIAYSLNPDHYSPRCVPCHKRFDLAHINATPSAVVR